MANNPHVNKVQFGNRMLIDLTGDSVTADTLGAGVTAHDRSGAQITGTAIVVPPTGVVKGVKGDAENDYRTGNVNITPANIGAVDKTGDTMTGPLIFEDYQHLEWPISNGAYTWAVRPASFGFQFLLFDSNGLAKTFNLLNDGHMQLPAPLEVAFGGTGATTTLGAVQNLFNTSIEPITQYPNQPGIYRTVSDIFAHMNPATPYGMLVIFEAGYGMHLYMDAYSNLYVGFSGDTFGEPSTWRVVTTTIQS